VFVGVIAEQRAVAGQRQGRGGAGDVDDARRGGRARQGTDDRDDSEHVDLERLAHRVGRGTQRRLSDKGFGVGVKDYVVVAQGVGGVDERT